MISGHGEVFSMTKVELLKEFANRLLCLMMTMYLRL